MNPKDYFNFRIESKDYEAKLVAANKNIKELRKCFLKINSINSRLAKEYVKNITNGHDS